MSRGPVLAITLTADDRTSGGFRSATAEAEGFGSRMSGFAVGVGAAFATMAAEVISSVGGMVADSLVAMDNADAQLRSQLGLSGEEAARFAEVGADVYAQAWGDSIGEVSLAAANVADTLQVTNDADLSNLTGQALALSDVFGVDVNTAVRTAGQLMKQGLVEDGQAAIDLLTVGMQQMPQDIRDELFEATNEYGTFFADLGFNGQQTFAALTTAADEYGIYGIDKTGDALKEFTIRATDMSTSSVAAYDTLGLSAQDMANSILAGGDTAQGAFQQIVDGLLDIDDPATRANTAIALFGTPLEDLGVEGIPTFLEGLQGMGEGFEDVDGAGERMANDATTWQSQIESFKRRGLMAMTTFITNEVVPTVQRLVTWFRENWPQIRAAVEPVLNWFVERSQQVWTIVSALWDTYGATIVQYVTGVFNAIRQIIEGVMLVIKGVIDVVLGVLTGDWQQAWDGIADIVDGVWSIINGLVDAAVNALMTIMRLAWDTLTAVTRNAWDAIKSAVRAGVDGVVTFVAGLPGRAVSALGSIATTLYSKGSDLIKGLRDGAEWYFTNVAKRFYVDLPLSVVNAIGNVAQTLYQKGKDVVAGMRDGVVDFWTSTLRPWLAGLPTIITNAVGNLGRALFNAGKQIIQGLIDGINDKVDDLRGLLGRVTDLIPDWKGPAGVDAKLLVESGQLVMGGFLEGLDQGAARVKGYLGGFTADLGDRTIAAPGYGGRGNTYAPTFNVPSGYRPEDVVRLQRQYERRNGVAA